jgi:glycosyltransferase involved in cell wall biosynthesis
MRICVVCSGFSSVYGGLESVYEILCDLWTKLGHEVFVISGFGKIRSSKQYKIIKVPFISRRFFEKFQRISKIHFPFPSYEAEGSTFAPFLASMLIKLKPDIVVSNTVFETIIPLKLGFPCVMVSQAAIRYRLWILKKAERVIVNDFQSYENLRNMGIEAELIMNGVEKQCNTVEINATELRAKYEIPPESRVILTVARLYDYKRINLLISAFEHIREDATLIVVGEGPELESLKRQASLTKSQNKIIFLKRVPRNQLDELYGLCSVFTLPSEESFGLVLIEALSFGKKVVTNPAPMKKIILGEFGIYANVEDPIEYSRCLLQATSDKIDINSSTYIQHMQRFNWEHIAIRYIDVFQNVIHNRHQEKDARPSDRSGANFEAIEV